MPQFSIVLCPHDVILRERPLKFLSPYSQTNKDPVREINPFGLIVGYKINRVF